MADDDPVEESVAGVEPRLEAIVRRLPETELVPGAEPWIDEATLAVDDPAGVSGAPAPADPETMSESEEDAEFGLDTETPSGLGDPGAADKKGVTVGEEPVPEAVAPVTVTIDMPAD